MPRPILLFFALVALFNLSRPLREPPLAPDRPMDFRTCYVGQVVLRAGGNPYDDGQLKAGWQRIVRREGLVSRTQPGLPNLPFMYPPWATALFGFAVGQVSYQAAWPLWYGLAVVALVAMAGLWQRLFAAASRVPLPWWQLLIAALALKGTVPALLTGQPTFLALALAVGAMVLGQHRLFPVFQATVPDSRSTVEPRAGLAGSLPSLQQPATSTGRATLAGLLLGLAAFKVTLVLPFVVWFAWRRQWATLLVAGAVVALLAGVALSWAHAPGELAPAYQQLVAQVRAQSFDPADPDYPLTQGMTLRLELGNVLEWLWPGSSPWHLTLHGGLWLAAGLRLAWLWRRGLVITSGYVFLVAAVLTLLTTYHLYYDALLVLPVLAYAMRLARREQLGLFVLLLPFFVPLNGLALALGNPVALHGLYFLLPLSLLGLLTLLLLRPVPGKPWTSEARTVPAGAGT